MHGLLGRARVHVGQAVHQRFHLGIRHQIGFADEDLVCKTNLAARFLAIVQLGVCVFGIDQRQDGVQQVLLGNFFVHKKRLRDRARVGQAGGFDHYAVKNQLAFALFFGQYLQCFA